MRNVVLVLALAPALGACTAGQLTQFFNQITTGCAVATAAEQADPSFAQHNGRIVNGVAYICADEASAQELAGTVNGQVNSLSK